MWSLVAMALAASGPDPAQLDEMSRGAPPVNWTIVFDSSADMLPIALAARADVATLVQALPVGDSIEILAFHSRAATVLPRTAVTEAERAALVETVKAVALPTAIDEDLGAGIQALGEALGAGDKAHGNEVLFLSRFCHAPSVSSPYDTGIRGCRPIRGQSGLEASLGTVLAEHDTWVRLFPVPTPNGPVDAAGTNAAKAALRAQVVTDTPFSAFMTATAANVTVERLRPLLAADVARAALTATVTSPGSPESPTVTVKVEAPLRLMQIRLVDPQVDGGTRVGDGNVMLNPSVELQVGVEPPNVPFALFHQDDVVPYDLTLRAGVTYEPTEILTALGLPKTRDPWSTPLRVEMPRSYGLPSPLGILVMLAGVVAVAGGLVAWRLRAVHRELGGAFHWRVGNGPRTELEISHLSEVALVIEADQLVAGPAERAVMVFRMAGPRWRAHAEVEVRRDGVEMNRKPLARGAHPVTPGAASFQFDGFRLTWE